MKLLLFFLLVSYAVCGPYDNSSYQAQTAYTKLNLLLQAINADSRPADWPNTFQQGELFLEGMDKTFTFAGDDFPKQGPFDLETRKKLIHSVGTIVEVEYVSLNSDYTGIFKSGAKNALLRFSVAKPVITSGGQDAMAPGIALKFLRSYVPSANVFGMYSLIGQPSFNFFAHDLSSHVPELPSDGPLPVQLLRKKFLSASDFPPFAGLSELAKYDEGGVSPSKVAFPFRLHFHPNATLHYSIPDYYTGMDFEYQLSKLIGPNTHLYDVYAQATPLNDKLTLIGKINSKGYPTTSNFGDKTLFFQHTKFEWDLDYYPSWEQPSRNILTQQRNTLNGGYHYPDLPFK